MSKGITLLIYLFLRFFLPKYNKNEKNYTDVLKNIYNCSDKIRVLQLLSQNAFCIRVFFTHQYLTFFRSINHLSLNDNSPHKPTHVVAHKKLGYYNYYPKTRFVLEFLSHTLTRHTTPSLYFVISTISLSMTIYLRNPTQVLSLFHF